MKIFNVITIARQVDGEYVFVKVEKSFLDQKRASDYANGLARKYAETINTSTGQIQCVCERGVFESETEE
jgi:hypothetical protein